MADIIGTTGPDTLTGTADADTISGLEGNDIIDGLAGADQMDGGAGDDVIYVDNLGDVIIEDSGEGYDNVLASVTYTLGAGVHAEILSTTNHLGTAQIYLTGNELSNILIGNAGSNSLHGGSGGVDRLAGLAGNDFLFVDSDDIVDEAVGGGHDNVLARSSYILTAGAAVEVLSTDNHNGTGDFDLTGNAFNQAVIGNDGSNWLRGGGGLDRFVGQGGDDFIFVDSADDIVEELDGDGFDNVLTSVSYSLTIFSRVEVFSTTDHLGTAPIRLSGNGFSQVIIGNDGDNEIDSGGIGGTFGDHLAGRKGNDNYSVNAFSYIVELPGEGFDTVEPHQSYTLNGSAEVEVIKFFLASDTRAFNFKGNEFAQTITGNAGSNIIDGGYQGGDDVLIGLGGNDFYIVDADDQIVEEFGAGLDNVLARENYVLAAGLSIEILSTDDHNGTASINLTGNEFAQIVIGNAGANILDGGAGDDRIQGLGGADSFAFTTTLGGANVDTILAFDADDNILLENAIFTALSTGALDPNAFHLGTAAADADDRIIYDAATGRVYYDADGTGSAGIRHFATIDNHFALTAGDFTVI